MKRLNCILALLLWCSYGHADTIEFPEEELATESVLPVFENAKSVKNRNIVTAGRFEAGGGMGLVLNEPFYNPLNFYGTATYHLDETHGINIAGMFFMDGLSTYGEDLKAGKGLNNATFDTSLAPQPEWMVLGSYQFTAYYGKISLTKKSVMNLSLSGLLGLGTISLGETSAVALNFGLGQKFYFSKNIALRVDLRMYIYNGPDATSQDLSVGNDPPPADSFDETTFFNTILTGGLVFLL